MGRFSVKSYKAAGIAKTATLIITLDIFLNPGNRLLSLSLSFFDSCTILDTICTRGRTDEEYEKAGTGTGVYLQQGPDPVLDSQLVTPLYCTSFCYEFVTIYFTNCSYQKQLVKLFGKTFQVFPTKLPILLSVIQSFFILYWTSMKRSYWSFV